MNAIGIALGMALLGWDPTPTPPSPGQAPLTSGQRVEPTAQVVLRRAADALGGAQALLEMDTVQATTSNRTTARHQTTTSGPPFEHGNAETDLSIELSRRRLSFRSAGVEQGRIFDSVSVIGDGDPLIYNVHARTFRPFTTEPSFSRELATHSRRVPQLLLRHAVENAPSLRMHAAEMFNGRMHDVVSFDMADGVATTLFIERETGLLSKVETPFSDMLLGRTTSQTVFSDYVGTGLERYPRVVETIDAGQRTAIGSMSVSISTPFRRLPSGLTVESYQRAPASRPNPSRVERLADGIYVLHSISDPAHNALAVEFETFVAVVDAPDSSEGGERLIRKIEEIIPNKPIRFVALTHHHGDHIGGLRSFIAEGASVITTPGNRVLVEDFAKAPHEDRLAENPQPLSVVTVSSQWHVVTDGSQRMELIDVGPNPHAREILIAYFPRERLIFQSDLFIVPSNEAPVGPPFDAWVAFEQAIDRLGLDVERIAGGHGRTATIEELRRATRFRHPD